MDTNEREAIEQAWLLKIEQANEERLKHWMRDFPIGHEVFRTGTKLNLAFYKRLTMLQQRNALKGNPNGYN